MYLVICLVLLFIRVFAYLPFWFFFDRPRWCLFLLVLHILKLACEKICPMRFIEAVVGREKLLIGSAVSGTYILLITHRYKHKSSSSTN